MKKSGIFSVTPIFTGSPDIKKPQLALVLFFFWFFCFVFFKCASFSQLLCPTIFCLKWSSLCTADKSDWSRWYGFYQGFQCNMALLAWVKGTFNDEEDLQSSVQPIMHCIIGYIRLRVSSILLSNLKFGILLNLPN